MYSVTIPYEKSLRLPAAPTGRIDHYLWLDNGYRPEAYFKICYNQAALRVLLRAEEPEVTITHLRDEDDVYEDSCLEFFFAPFGIEGEYLNFECNAAGAMLIHQGADRDHWRSVTARVKPLIAQEVQVEPGKGWQICYTIPFSLIEELFGRPFAPEAGARFRFNAYLCGDETPAPHFGAWSPVEVPEPDFHRPEFFGEGVLGL